jgi:hypothetical protein
MAISPGSAILGSSQNHSQELRERNDGREDRKNRNESGRSKGRSSGKGGAEMRRTVDLSRLLSSEAISHTRLADHSGVILDIDSLQVFSVNDTGMCLVEALRDGIDDHEGLVRRIVDEFEIDRETAAGDVDAFVEELAHYLVDRRA